MDVRIDELSANNTEKLIDIIEETADKLESNNEEVYEIDTQIYTEYLRINKKENKIKRLITLFIKRIIDILASIIGLIIFIPLTIIVAIMNFINKDNGPIFYYHRRIGKNGKYFNLIKYRTMVVDADERLKELLENDENAKKCWEENRKIKDDPRITKAGKILRKTSLDEWPQFLNVLKGDMSLIGPRPVIDGEIEKFGIYKKDVLSVRPGITSNWAANGRSCTNYDDRVFLENQYVQKFSALQDIKILFKTVIAVLKREGAV